MKKKFQQKEQDEEASTLSESANTTDDDSDAISMINSDNSLSNIPIFSNRERSTSSTSIGSFASSIEVTVNPADEKDRSVTGIANQVRKQRSD